jgi:hypothetical protein
MAIIIFTILCSVNVEAGEVFGIFILFFNAQKNKFLCHLKHLFCRLFCRLLNYTARGVYNTRLPRTCAPASRDRDCMAMWRK